MSFQTVYRLRLLFVFCIAFGSKNFNRDNVQDWLPVIARYVLYFILIRGTQEMSLMLYKTVRSQQLDVNSVIEQVKQTNWINVIDENKKTLVLFFSAITVLVYMEQEFFNKDFALLFAAYLISKYPQMEEQPSSINYGVGMAYSFFEGYLVHVIPSDGHRFVGFQENIRAYEGSQGVFFPVKRMFLVITKSLYCPPDLKDFNKHNRADLASIEACTGLENIEKDVAGVKNRSYRNSAYKIHRAVRPHSPHRPPVYLAAECATPLHTLYRVLANTNLYRERNVNVTEVVNDFRNTLQTIIERNPETRGKCELVYYDDTDPNQNLADVLLDKVREIEPNFEELIVQNNSLVQ